MSRPGQMRFEDALTLLRDGNAVKRDGWKNVAFIKLQKPTDMSKMTEPYIYAVDKQNKHVPWLASQVDLFAEDWMRM
jgi:hypothetical protein